MLLFTKTNIIYADETHKLELEIENLPSINIDNFQIRFYPQFKDQYLAKQYLENNYYSTIQKVIVYSNDYDISIDDKKFLDIVFTTELMETEQDKELRKYLDLYENKEKNEMINSLYLNYIDETDTLKKEQILYALEEIMPIDTSKVNNILYTNHTNNFKFLSLNSGISPMVLPFTPLEPGVYSNGYNRNVAREYAYTWAYTRNNTKYGYYARRGNCSECWADCTNFVSQVLYEGGMIQYHKAFWPIVGNIIQENSNNWYYYDNNNSEAPSYTWGAAVNFYNHWSKRTVVTTYPSMIKEMDSVSIDFEGDGDVEHTVIIYTKTSNSLAGLTYVAHSNYALGASLQNAVGTGKWYGYIMEVAKNDGTFID